MRIAISNLAWDISNDEEIGKLLNTCEVDAIDVAPGKYFPNIKTASVSDVNRVRDWWASRGITITGMQSLLFGTSGLNMFGDKETQESMLDQLDAVCRVGAGLGATRLVFGSPKNRDRSSFSDEQAHSISVSFFQHLGQIADRYGIMFCLEPNPICYGSNFMTNCAETAKVVIAVNHPSIRMQFDTGALTINDEDPDQVIAEFGSLIGHVHASEPNLVVLGEGKTDHQKMASALMKGLPEQIVSIEMLTSQNVHNIIAVENALKVAIRNYRESSGQGSA